MLEGKDLKSNRPMPDRTRRILAQAYDLIAGTTIYHYTNHPDCEEPNLHDLVDTSQGRPHILLSWLVVDE